MNGPGLKPWSLYLDLFLLQVNDGYILVIFSLFVFGGSDLQGNFFFLLILLIWFFLWAMLIWEIIIVFLVFGYKGAFYPQKKEKLEELLAQRMSQCYYFWVL